MSKQSISSLQPSRDSYSVVVVGGGSAALATAYYLVRQHNIRDIAVIAPAGFGSAANGIYSLPVADCRKWYRLALRQRSRQLLQGLAQTTGKTLNATTRGLLSLAPDDDAVAYARGFALGCQRAGVSSDFLSADELQQLLPRLDASAEPTLAAAWQADVDLVDEFDLLTSYAGALHSYGVDLVERCPLRAVEATAGAPLRIQVGDHDIQTTKLACCLPEDAQAVAKLIGAELPLQLEPWRIWSSAPSQSWLGPLLYSLRTRSWLSQDSRGVLSSAGPSAASYAAMAEWSRLLPGLGKLPLHDCVETSIEVGLDQAPVLAIDCAPGVHISCGWGLSGDLAPALGEFFAHSVVHSQLHPALRPFDWRRFADAQTAAA